MSAVKLGKCPICSKPADRDSSAFPFCSKRCKIIDLGAWASEDYVVTRPLNEADENYNSPAESQPPLHED